MNTKKRLLSLLICIFTMAPMVSFAQDDTEENSLVVTTHTVTGAVVYTLIFYSFLALAYGSISTTTSGVVVLTKFNANELSALESYVGEHGHQLAQDIALGGGETIDDLAQLYDVPQDKQARFAKALRRERRALMLAQAPSRKEVERFGLLVLKIKYELDGIQVAIAH